MTTETTEAEVPAADEGPAVEAYVRDALRKNGGGKFEDLGDEQRERALAAPKDKPGLRGKALAIWVTDGVTGTQQVRAAGIERAGQRAEDVHQARSEAAKRGGRRPPQAASKYPDEVRAAVKRAAEIRGKPYGAGPKQHAHVREVVARLVSEDGGGPVTQKAILGLAGVKSMKQLRGLADGSAPREDLKVLRDLAAEMGDDPWCKGRHLALALAAWAEQVEA